MQVTAAQIASAAGGVVDGDPSAVVSSLSALSDAGEGSLTFLTNAKYSDLLATTKATAVVVKSDWAGASSAKALIRVANPDRGFAIAATLVAPPPPARPAGIHPTACVAPTAKIGANVHIGPMAVVQDGAAIGDNSVIEAQCFIGEDVVIGKDAHVYPQVTIRERVRIGDRFIAHCGVRLGCDGFGYAVEMLPNGLPRIDKIPQVGTVVIGNDVEIGANTCIDRARFGETYIGDSVKIDNLVQIGHNVRINAFSGVVAQAGIAGSTTVGSGVKIWSQAGVSGHLHIADGAQVGPQCGVTKDVPPGAYVIGSPEMSMRNFIGIKEAPQQISKLRMRVAKLEREASNKDGKENA